MRTLLFIFSLLLFLKCTNELDKDNFSISALYRGDVTEVSIVLGNDEILLTSGKDSIATNIFDKFVITKIFESGKEKLIKVDFSKKVLLIGFDMSSNSLDSISNNLKYNLNSDYLILGCSSNLIEYSSTFLGYVSPKITVMSVNSIANSSDVITLLMEINSDVVYLKDNISQIIVEALL